MTSATLLLAKEKVLKTYVTQMDKLAAKHTSGLNLKEFDSMHGSVVKGLMDTFSSVTILGDNKTRTSAWKSIEESLSSLEARYRAENERRLEMALVGHGNIALLAIILFMLDRISDYTCDWWSTTCQESSELLFATY